LRYSYLVVEGPQDLAFIGRLLRISGLRKVREFERLGAFWRPVVPRAFPVDGDLLKRVPLPVFFQSGSHSVAVHASGGISRLVPTVQETLIILGADRANIASIGLFLDADWGVTVGATFGRIKAQLEATGLPAADEPGVVHDRTPRTGVFIFPDNKSPGTLENLLDQCAAVVYPELRDKARQFTAGAATAPLTKKDRREFTLPAGEIKVIVGTIANFLKPARAIQNSIEDNRWLCSASLDLENIGKLHAFLKALLEV
jgi:Protein of unknown function (DUF3226)